MEPTVAAMLILLAAGACAFAINVLRKEQQAKNRALSQMVHEFEGMKEYIKNLDDERTRDLDAMNEVFDWLNDNAGLDQDLRKHVVEVRLAVARGNK